MWTVGENLCVCVVLSGYVVEVNQPCQAPKPTDLRETGKAFLHSEVQRENKVFLWSESEC